MPIHGPREDTRYKPQVNDEQVFIDMLDDWILGKNRHRTKFHFPDYSCCFKSIKTPQKIKNDFRRALLSGDAFTVQILSNFFKNNLDIATEAEIAKAKAAKDIKTLQRR